MGLGAINQFVNTLHFEESLYADFVSTMAQAKV